MQRKLAVVLAICAIALLCAVGANLAFGRALSGGRAIGAAILPCYDAQRASMSETCMRPVIRNLLGTYSTAQLMSYVVATNSPQQIVAQCHVVAHTIGEETYRRSNSLEDALSKCTDACSHGCTHGAIATEVAREFGDEYLGDDIAHADTKELDAVGKKYCVDGNLCHGMGHIARIAAGSLAPALATCDRISDTYRKGCYLGVFMEDNGVTSFTHDGTSTPPDYGFPCDRIPQAYAHACYMQLSDYQFRRFDALRVPQNERFAISQRTCQALPASQRYDCFYGFGYKLDRNLTSDGTQQNAGRFTCDRLSPQDAAACKLGLAFNYASFSRYGDFITLCDSTPQDLRRRCYEIGFQGAPHDAGVMERACAQSGSSYCSAELASYSRTAR